MVLMCVSAYLSVPPKFNADEDEDEDKDKDEDEDEVKDEDEDKDVKFDFFYMWNGISYNLKLDLFQCKI